MRLEDFTRLYDFAFSFRCTLQDNLYSSMVSFHEKTTDERFAELLPHINNMLEWLDSNVDSIRLQVIEDFPQDANMDEFNACWIVSFSFIFKLDGTLCIQIMYGDETGCYIGANVKNKKVCEVWLIS